MIPLRTFVRYFVLVAGVSLSVGFCGLVLLWEQGSNHELLFVPMQRAIGVPATAGAIVLAAVAFGGFSFWLPYFLASRDLEFSKTEKQALDPEADELAPSVGLVKGIVLLLALSSATVLPWIGGGTPTWEHGVCLLAFVAYAIWCRSVWGGMMIGFPFVCILGAISLVIIRKLGPLHSQAHISDAVGRLLASVLRPLLLIAGMGVCLFVERSIVAWFSPGSSPAKLLENGHESTESST